MNRNCSWILLAIGAAAVSLSTLPAAAQTFYREDFANVGDTTLAGHGWNPQYIGTADALATGNANSAGVVPTGGAQQEGFHWWFNFTQLQNPVVTVTEASVTAAGEIATPITPVADLAFSWEQRLENMQDNSFAATTGIPVVVRLAVQMNGSSWYASNATFPTGDTGVSSTGAWTAHSLPFTTAAANWRTLTLSPVVPMTATPTAVIGAAPGAPLSGNITGVGWVATFSQYGTINFNFIEIGVPPIPGDVNGDGDVDLDDFETIRTNFSTAVGSREDGDLTGDGVVDLNDFGQWKDNYPFPGGGGGGLANSGSAPEPSSLVMIALALGWALGRSRRRSHRVT